MCRDVLCSNSSPEDERLEPENTAPLEKENHLNQGIIFRFYVNLRGCSVSHVSDEY